MSNTLQDIYFQRLLQQARLEPLQLPLIPSEPIPVISASSATRAAPVTTQKRPARRVKNKGGFAKFFKKFIYFKPKTFWGTQILIPILSTTIGIWVTAIVKQPSKHHHAPKDNGRMEQQQPATNANNISTTQIAYSLDLLSQLYQSWSTNTADGVMSNKTMVCPSCNHTIKVDSLSFLQPVITCADCQQFYQAAAQSNAKERE